MEIDAGTLAIKIVEWDPAAQREDLDDDKCRSFRCVACDESNFVTFEYEPSPLCNRCVHEAVDVLTSWIVNVAMKRLTDGEAEAWFNEGQTAAEMDLSREACPYTDHPAKHWWTRGFVYVARILRALDAEMKVLSLEARRDELLALVANISQSTPLASEMDGWEGQRARLIAEVGTLRAEVSELREGIEAEKLVVGGVLAGLESQKAEAIRRWQEAEARLANALSIVADAAATLEARSDIAARREWALAFRSRADRLMLPGEK